MTYEIFLGGVRYDERNSGEPKLICSMTSIKGFGTWRWKAIFLFSESSRSNLRLTQPPIQRVMRLKWTECELTTHLYLVPRLRINGVIALLPYMPSWHGQVKIYIFTVKNSCIIGFCKEKCSSTHIEILDMPLTCFLNLASCTCFLSYI